MANCVVEELPPDVEFAPCTICGRTFLPQSLEKHAKICAKNAIKRRKVFDSKRQRVEGTELALFNLPVFKKSTVSPPKTSPPKTSPPKTSPPKTNPTKCNNKTTISLISPSKEESRSKPGERIRPTAGMNLNPMERCPHCERQFGIRSYDRHVVWCREKHLCLPANLTKSEAKERLEARLNYRGPLVHKRTVREKYQSPPTADADSLKTAKSSFQRGGVRRTISGAPTASSIQGHQHHEKSEKKEVSRQKPSPKRRTTSLSSSLSPTNPENPSENNNVPSDIYNPFLMAEKQLMELLECNDFKPYHKSTNLKTSKVETPISTATPTPTPVSKSLKPTEKNAHKTKKRQSVIDPPTDFKDTRQALEDDIDFEMLENFINDNFGNEEVMHKLDLDAISLNSCSTSKTIENANDSSSYFEDVSIDPRLINDFDNLSIPDHLDSHGTSTPDVIRAYPGSKSNKSHRFHHGDYPNEAKAENKQNSRNSGCEVTQAITESSKKHLEREIERDKGEKSGKMSSEKVKNKTKNKDFESLLKNDELFLPDDDIYEEYKQLEETFYIERENNRDVLNAGNPGQGICAADSAYGRSPKIKIRSKIMLLSPLEPAYQKDVEENAAEDESEKRDVESSDNWDAVSSISSISQSQRGAVFAKFCHQCGKAYPLAVAKFCVWCGQERLVL